MSKKVKIILIVLVLVFLVLSFGAGFITSRFVSQGFIPAVSAPSETPKELGTLWEVWDVLHKNYVEREVLDDQKLAPGAIRGLIEALDDPYTTYMDPTTYEMEIAGFHGKFQGIGAHVNMRDDQLEVIAPIPGTPAEKAGIRPGDAILEVNGETTRGLGLHEVVLKIRGPEGTPVTLLIRHLGQEESETIIIVRAEIDVPSVRSELQEGIARIQILYFSQRTGKEVKDALRELTRQEVNGILLDLRNNPGGVLQAVVEVADEFLDEGIILHQLNNKGDRKTWMAHTGGLAVGLPLAVLVNEHSASGSEVLAGTFQDRGIPIFGTTTYGKGSVNILYPLGDGSALYLTTARWLTPKGRLIEGEGLVPDILVEMTEEDLAREIDLPLDQALSYLRDQIRSRSTAALR
ncbi:MAG: S41 family peptidase [Dehalococcoidia bacterium]